MAPIPFRPTPDQILNLALIVLEMEKAGIDRKLIVAADELARRDRDAFVLMDLWVAAPHDSAERDETIAEIQNSIDHAPFAPRAPQNNLKPTKPIRPIKPRWMVVKTKLRQLIDEHGGVSAVAQKSGIPQPSLS